MAWPEDILDLIVEAYLGETLGWVDITTDVYGHDRGNISIARGRSSRASSLEPGRTSITLNNRDGRYSPRNPRSPYYGLVGRNTPIRVWVRGPDAYLWVPDTDGSLAQVASSTDLDITGDIDVRIELSLDELPTMTDDTYEWAIAEIAGRWTGDTSWSWRLILDRLGQPDLAWTTTGSDYTEQFVRPPLPYFSGQRFALRATLDVDNGAGGHDVRIYTAPSIEGPWVQHGETGTGDGATSVYAPTDTPLEVGAVSGGSPHQTGAGRYYRFQLRDGIDGTVIVDVDFTAQTEGDSSFTDAAGNTWTLAGDATVTAFHRRACVEASAWPLSWAHAGKDVWTNLDAAGPLRRLSQGAAPLQSTLRRRIPTGDPLAYWPMEEGSEATQAYSPIEGVDPMRVADFDFAADATLPGSDALPRLGDNAGTAATVPRSAAADAWQLEFVYLIPEGPEDPDTRVLEWEVGGAAYAGYRLTLGMVGPTTPRVRLIALNDEADESVLIDENWTHMFGTWSRFQAFSYIDGGTGNTVLALQCINIGGTSEFSGLYIAGAPGYVTTINTNVGAGMDGASIGHLAVFAEANTVAFNSADHAFTGERAVARVQRFAEEEHVRMIAAGRADESEVMGPQRIATLLTNIEDVVDADGGVLLEQRETLGLQYRSRTMLYNPAPVLTLDYTVSGEVVAPFEPVDDDTDTRNDRTVQRRDGSSARAVLTEGPLSVQAPPDGVGLYADSTTLSLAEDAQAARIAPWLLHLGTVDGARYPSVTVNLRTAHHLIPQVLSLDVGDVIEITNLPEWLPPGPIRLRVDGYTETLNAFEWVITFNCSPASPWTVGVADDTVLGRADTSGSTLAAAVTTTGTELLVATPAGTVVPRARWTTCGTSGTANPDFQTDLTGWSSYGSARERVATPGPAPVSSTWSIKVTPGGTLSSPNAFSAQAPVSASATYHASGWLRCSTARSLRLSINWYTGGGSYVSTSSLTQTVAANTWTYFAHSATAPGTAGLANLSPILPGMAPVTDVMWGTALYLREAGGRPEDFPFDVRLGGEVARVHTIADGQEDALLADGVGTATVSSSHVAPSLDAPGGADLLVCAWIPWDQPADYTLPVSMTEQAQTSGTWSTLADATEVLDAAGATGTRTATRPTEDAWAAMSVLVSGAPSTTPAIEEHLSGSSSSSQDVTLTTAAGTEAGWWLVALQGWDNNDLAELVTPSGAGWTLLADTGAPDSAIPYITAWAKQVSAPGAQEVTLSGGTPDDNHARLYVLSGVTDLTAQVMTVTRSVNGITKTHGAGTDVRLAQPTITAL